MTFEGMKPLFLRQIKCLCALRRMHCYLKYNIFLYLLANEDEKNFKERSLQEKRFTVLDLWDFSIVRT